MSCEQPGFTFEIGTDWQGTLSSVTFDGTAGSVAATFVVTLYDEDNVSLGTGTGTFVSSGLYRIRVAASVFASEAPTTITGYKRGRLNVLITEGGVSAAFGGPVTFAYADATNT